MADRGPALQGDRGPVVLAVTASFFSIATVFVILRLLSRAFIVHRVRLDDWFIVAAWTIAFGLSFSICDAVKYGLGRHQGTLSDSNLETLERLEYTFSVLYNPALMATKTSICIFYLSLAAKTLPVFRWSVIGTMVVVNVAGLALSLLNIFQCRPLRALFLYPRPDTSQCTDILTLYLSSAPVNIITDLVILLLPMPVLKSMWLPKKEKLILYVTFGFGVFVMVVDIVRISYLQSAAQNRLALQISSHGTQADSQQQTDFNWYISFSFMWSAIEVNVGIMVASVPHLKPLVTRFLPKMLRESGESTPGGRNSIATLNSLDMAAVHRVPSLAGPPLSPISPLRTRRQSKIPNEGAMTFEDFLNSPAAVTNMPTFPRMERTDTAVAHASEDMGRGSSFMNFVDMSEMKSIVYLNNKESFKPVAIVTVLFFIWGFAYGLLNTLNGQFQVIANMSTTQTLAQHGMYYAGYLLGPLTIGRLILKHWGFKACYILGLMIYGTGTLVFWPAAVLTSFAAFLISNFIVGVGLSTLEIAANPFMALCGPQKYAEVRLNLSQGVQAIGTVVSPLLAQKALFGHVKDAPTLIDVQWTYLAISLFTFILAFIYYIIKLPECTDSDLETASRLNFPDGGLDRLRSSNTMVITLALAVFAQFLYVGAQEGVGTSFESYLHYVEPDAIYVNYLAIGHSLFAVSRFIAALAGLFILPRYLLLFFFTGAVLFSILSMNFSTSTASTMSLLVFFFEGPLFSLIFAQALRGLGKHTKDGATLLTAAISGGGLFSPIQNAAAVAHNWQYSYCVEVATFGGGLAFALYLNAWPPAREQCDPGRDSGALSPPSRGNTLPKGDSAEHDAYSSGAGLELALKGTADDAEPRSPMSWGGEDMTETPVSAKRFSFMGLLEKRRPSQAVAVRAQAQAQAQAQASFEEFQKDIAWGEKMS